MIAVVQFSGGLGSWGAARAAVRRVGAENVTLLFADTLIEDDDLYRFIDEVRTQDSVLAGVRFVRLADGRTPWQVFRDVKFIGNTRADPCSMILKRDLLRKWIEEHVDPEDALIVLGIDWTEIERFDRAVPRWEPYTLWAPLCDDHSVSKDDLLLELKAEGIARPRLYEMGFPHNNCGGFCIKAGQAHFKLLLEKLPERYLAHELEEEATRQHLGKDVSILRDRSKAGVAAYEATHGTREGQVDKTVPLTLRRFREKLGVNAADYDPEEWGGCGCAIE
jgi:hypothetical protein